MKGEVGRPRKNELPKDGDPILDKKSFYCQKCAKLVNEGHYCNSNGEIIKVCDNDYEKSKNRIAIL